ncbi:heavy metal translocating P-type ATPase [Vibrio scophthalmi]|uniref:heavy metal translocating P-type ATPase n=1 Tax=Vibrio scophthalmi TaxID=45658 RepID=UPI002FF3AA47
MKMSNCTDKHLSENTSTCCSSTHNHSHITKENKDDHQHTETVLQHDQNGCGSCSTPTPSELKSLSGSEKVGNDVRTEIRIMQMDCPVEEQLIQKKLGGMNQVKNLEFNLMQRVLTVTHTTDSLDKILVAIRSLGFEPDVSDKSQVHKVPHEKEKPLWPLALAGISAIGSELVHWMGMSEWVQATLALIAVLSCGLTTYKKGWISIRNANLNMNALMSIAVTGAFIIGQWPEAAMVMVLFTIAELVEAKSLDRARNAIGSLMSLTPDTVIVQQSDNSWKEVDAQTVQLGATVRVKPGERIGLDGNIIKGQTTINQAPITGESMPVDKIEGDSIFAGTINQAGAFEYRVTAAANNTTLARIIHAVEEAQGAKAPTQRFVDRFSQIYTPAVIAIAFAVAVLPPILGYGEWLDWIYKALVMLVIACPCALVISTPVTIVSGLTAAARKGILIKGGVYLEQGRKLEALALDKTGTITYGKPKLIDVITFNEWTEDSVCSIGFNLTNLSDHPVSTAIATALSTQKSIDVGDFKAIAGEGVSGTIAKQKYYLGNQNLVERHFTVPADIKNQISKLEKQGKTVSLLHNGIQVLGLFSVADTVKESSRVAVQQLHDLGIKTIMLSGDNSHTASAVASQVGIDEAHGNQLPEDKYRTIETYSSNGVIGMVGDGINDAPALAAANIGFSMGAMGTDTAIETSDVALMDDDLRKIPTFVSLSKRTYQILIQNISFALAIKALFLVLTFAGVATMWMAVFADVGASLLVVANGLRLLKK